MNSMRFIQNTMAGAQRLVTRNAWLMEGGRS